jgi:hypothetical protein
MLTDRVHTTDLSVWDHLEDILIAGRSITEICCDDVNWKEVKMTVFWDVAPCSMIDIDRHFRGVYCLHHQGDHSFEHL